MLNGEWQLTVLFCAWEFCEKNWKQTINKLSCRRGVNAKLQYHDIKEPSAKSKECMFFPWKYSFSTCYEFSFPLSFIRDRFELCADIAFYCKNKINQNTYKLWIAPTLLQIFDIIICVKCVVSKFIFIFRSIEIFQSFQKLFVAFTMPFFGEVYRIVHS